MKSKTSCFNKTIYKKNLTHFWPIWAIMLLYQVCILPFRIYVSYLSTKSAMGYTAQELANKKTLDVMLSIEMFINPVVIFIFAVITAMAVCSYLYSPRSANMMHAMPVTRKELFITNYLSGITFLFLPQILAFVLAILVAAACGYTSLIYLLMGLFYAMGLSFFFFSLCVFTAMFTGQLFGLPFFAVVVSFLYIGGKAIIAEIAGSISYGGIGMYKGGKLDVLSPLYYLMGKVGLIYKSEYEQQICDGLGGGTVIAGYCIVAIVLIIISYVIYQKRKIETAGSLLSIAWIQPIFRWGVGVCGAGLCTVFICTMLDYRFVSKEIYIAAFSTLVFGGISFFAAQMLLEKGFFVFKKKRIWECGIFVACMLGLLVGVEANIFGQETRVPKTEDIKTAFISSNYIVQGTTEDQINGIKKIHEQIISAKKEYEKYGEGEDAQLTMVIVKYILKDDRVMNRSYYIPNSEEYQADTNSVHNNIAKQLYNKETYMENMFAVNYEDIEVQGGSFDSLGENGSIVQKYFDKTAAEKLYEAVIADLDAGNMDNMMNSNFWNNDNNDKYQEEVYYNSLYLDLYCKDGIMQVWDVYNGYMGASNENYFRNTLNTGASVFFDSHCTNIIETLIDIGLISDKSDLITINDKTALDEEKGSTTAEYAR